MEPTKAQSLLLECVSCGIGHAYWVMNEQPCTGDGSHEWQIPNGRPLEGRNVIIGGQSAYQIGGFISWD